MFELLKNPWPWYVAGPLIGLTVPFLLVVGNKNFGLSSTFRHMCAALLPSKLPYFRYDWKLEAWNLIFVTGTLCGAAFAAFFLANPNAVLVSPALAEELVDYGIVPGLALSPEQIFSIPALGTFKGFVMMIVGGFFVGFGTRYGGGCTSGHAITGLSTLQPASLKATLSFMAGGFLIANLVIPFILKG